VVKFRFCAFARDILPTEKQFSRQAAKAPRKWAVFIGEKKACQSAPAAYTFLTWHKNYTLEFGT